MCELQPPSGKRDVALFERSHAVTKTHDPFLSALGKLHTLHTKPDLSGMNHAGK